MKLLISFCRALDREAEHAGRVHSSTEKHADGNIRDHVLLDCFRQQAQQFSSLRP